MKSTTLRNVCLSLAIAGIMVRPLAADVKGHDGKPLKENTVDATAPYDSNNVFARILRKELPAKIVYESDYALGFHTIDPRAKVHILVIPKGPYTNFISFTEQASPEEQLGLLKAIRDVAAQMGVKDSGFRLLTNTGHHGGQSVPHLHFHVLGGEPVPGLALRAKK